MKGKLGNVKPPVGVIPRWLITEARLTDLKEGIERYEADGFSPLEEWLEELDELEYWLKLHRLKNNR